MSARRGGGLPLDPRLAARRRRPSLILVGGVLALLVLASVWWGLTRGTSAGSSPASPEESYRRSVGALRASEEAAIAALAEVTGTGYVDDAQVVRALRERALPGWERVVAGLAEITPPPHLAEHHARLLKATRTETAALTRLATALEAGDGVAVILANVAHREACLELDAVAGDLTAALADASPRP